MKLRLLNIVFWAFLLCAVVSVSATPTAGLWIDLPFVAQHKNGCGPAAISMIMQYWAKQIGEPASPSADLDKIQKLLFSPSDKGVWASAMQNYLEQNGYRTFALRGEWDDFEHYLAQGRPLIVSLKASGSHGPLHYAVVTGVDWRRDFIFLNDPARGKMLRLSREDFEGEWAGGHNWMLLVLPGTDAGQAGAGALQ
jgi:ABC-type bacteriocin/lantibiotic exporter with double-glycine peptidase domain